MIRLVIDAMSLLKTLKFKTRNMKSNKLTKKQKRRKKMKQSHKKGNRDKERIK